MDAADVLQKFGYLAKERISWSWSHHRSVEEMMIGMTTLESRRAEEVCERGGCADSEWEAKQWRKSGFE